MKKRLISAICAAALCIGTAGAGFSAGQADVTVNGWKWRLPTVTGVNEQGGGTTYVKLRDLAYILNGTGGQFGVEFDGSTLVTTGVGYVPVGDELRALSGAEVQQVSSVMEVNGESRTLEAVWVKTGESDGYLCYKLRELGDALGLNIGWTAEQGVTITTGYPADTADSAQQPEDRVTRETLKILEQDKLIYGE